MHPRSPLAAVATAAVLALTSTGAVAVTATAATAKPAHAKPVKPAKAPKAPQGPKAPGTTKGPGGKTARLLAIAQAQVSHQVAVRDLALARLLTGEALADLAPEDAAVVSAGISADRTALAEIAAGIAATTTVTEARAAGVLVGTYRPASYAVALDALAAAAAAQESAAAVVVVDTTAVVDAATRVHDLALALTATSGQAALVALGQAGEVLEAALAELEAELALAGQPVVEDPLV